MALSTYSKFYYGLTITEDNCKIDFKEGATKKVATLTAGNYTFAKLAIEIARALNVAGTQVYSVSVNRTNRKITISAATNFSLLTFTGDYLVVTAFNLLGFDMTADYAGSNSYTSATGAGFEYAVQFPMQSYIPTTSHQSARDGAVKESTSGVIEAVKFGTKKRMVCEVLFITDILQPGNTPIRSNPSGYEEMVSFLEFAVSKAPVEFIIDDNKPSEFQIFILESTEQDQNGLGFKLIEEYDKGLPGYYRTGNLTWILQE